MRYRRNFVAGGTYFFTVALRNRRTRFLIDNIAVLRSSFRTVRTRLPFDIEAIVVLPDHLHALMTLPAGDADYSERWRRIKALFTLRASRTNPIMRPNRRGERLVWQRRFWEHTIRDDIDYERHVDYIHFNPVKHELVPSASDWPYSSFHRYVRQGRLPVDWAGNTADDNSSYGEPSRTQ